MMKYLLIVALLGMVGVVRCDMRYMFLTDPKGETIEFECPLGSDENVVYWFKGEKQLSKKHPRFLYIKHLSRDSSGKYSCITNKGNKHDFGLYFIPKTKFNGYTKEVVVNVVKGVRNVFPFRLNHKDLPNGASANHTYMVKISSENNNVNFDPSTFSVVYSRGISHTTFSVSFDSIGLMSYQYIFLLKENIYYKRNYVERFHKNSPSTVNCKNFYDSDNYGNEYDDIVKLTYDKYKTYLVGICNYRQPKTDTNYILYDSVPVFVIPSNFTQIKYVPTKECNKTKCDTIYRTSIGRNTNLDKMNHLFMMMLGVIVALILVIISLGIFMYLNRVRRYSVNYSSRVYKDIDTIEKESIPLKSQDSEDFPPPPSVENASVDQVELAHRISVRGPLPLPPEPYETIDFKK